MAANVLARESSSATGATPAWPARKLFYISPVPGDDGDDNATGRLVHLSSKLAIAMIEEGESLLLGVASLGTKTGGAMLAQGAAAG